MESKIYIMINHTNGARIECTEKYLLHWLSMGFEVEEIRYNKVEPGNIHGISMNGKPHA